MVLAGLHEAGRARVPRPVRRSRGQHPPGAVPVVPRYVGPGRRARLRREGHRRHPVRRRRGRRHRPDHRPERSCPCEDDDDVESLHERIKVAERPCSSTPWAGWPAKASPSPTGRCGSADDRAPRTRAPAWHEHPRPDRDQAGAGLGLRQDRARGPGPRPARRRRGAGLHRRLGQADRRPRPPGDQGRGPDRLPRVPRRPGQDAAPEGARRHPRRPAAADPRRAARRARRRAVRPGRLQPLPVHRDRDLGRLPGRVRRADRHRRPVDGPRGGEEPPVGRDRHLADALRRRARRAAAGGFTLEQRKRARRRGVRAHRDVRRARGQLDGQRADRHLRRRRLPGLGRRHLGPRPACCGTARTRTSRPRSTSTASAPASRRRASCTARRCPTTTTSTPTRPAGRPTTSTSRPSRSSSTPTRAASRSAPTSPRRTARPTSATRSRPSAA